MRRTIPAIIALICVTLAGAQTASGERDYSVGTFADSGTQLRTDLPVAVEQWVSNGPVAMTVQPSLVVGSQTVATLDPLTIASAPQGMTAATILIPAAAMAAVRAAATEQHTNTVTLHASTTAAASPQVTESSDTPLTLSAGTAVHGRLRIRAADNGTRPRHGANISIAVPAGWRLSSASGYLALVKQLPGRCTLSVSRVAYVTRAVNIRRRVEQAMISAALIRTAARPLPMAFGVLRPDVTPRWVRAAGAVSLGRQRYAILVLNGRLGAGCDLGESGVASALNAMQPLLGTLRRG